MALFSILLLSFSPVHARLPVPIANANGSTTLVGHDAFVLEQVDDVEHKHTLTRFNFFARKRSISIFCSYADRKPDPGSIIIPTMPRGVTIKYIGDRAFQGNYIPDQDFPGSIEAIGADAFQGNYIPDQDFPDSIEAIGADAFKGNPPIWPSHPRVLPPILKSTPAP